MAGEVAFFFLAASIFAIGSYVLQRLYHNCSLSEQEIAQRLSEHEMIEMNELLQERRYMEEPGKILLPMGA